MYACNTYWCVFFAMFVCELLCMYVAVYVCCCVCMLLCMYVAVYVCCCVCMLLCMYVAVYSSRAMLCACQLAQVSPASFKSKNTC